MAAPRIILATAGSLGDLHPFLALGEALKARGARVQIATSLEYQPKVQAEGLLFQDASLGLADFEAELGLDLAGITRKIAQSNFWFYDNIVLPNAAAGARRMIELAEGADVIVASSFALGAQLAAQKLGLPFVSVALSPMLFMSAHEPTPLPGAPWLKPRTSRAGLALNRATLNLGRLLTRGFTERVNAARATLGLPPSRDNVIFDTPWRADLVLGLFSPVLGGPLPDHPANTHITGYACYDSEMGGPPALPQALAAFLDAGEPPIVFTLGSAAVHIADRFHVEGLAAARALNRRAVLLVGPDGDLGLTRGATDAITVSYAPYSLLFPRAAANVHQGGVGTTQQALRAGRPQLVVPHLGDQFDNGARIAARGAGVVLKRDRFKAGAAAESLSRLLGDSKIAERAAAAEALSGAENGAAVGADLVIGLATRRRARAAAPNRCHARHRAWGR
ncbi:glycosyltransferase [Caulobacter segnis]|uniref:glycosyltransferase n=1 Tax=Caulobacter segnis TaxID=88688 RepID=UPI0024106D89|nr:glycosyltransferase [Caulobacter segnis]MDG2522823.1 glycosyltransferase [Caulobacter segnis]